MQVSDADHIDRLISCLYMALPFVVVRCTKIVILLSDVCLSGNLQPFIFCLMQRGASSSKFLNYLNKHIMPVFDKVSIL